MPSPYNAITNQGAPFLEHLRRNLATATKVDIIVAFIMENGAKLITSDLKFLAARNVPIRILTGTYLAITEPSALYHLRRELGAALDLRIFRSPGISFHPKAYLVTQDTRRVVFVGSSNISVQR